MAAEKVVVLDYGECNVINSFPGMDTHNNEAENMQDTLVIKYSASAIMYDEEDSSNKLPRSIAEVVKTTSKMAATLTRHENLYKPTLPGIKYCLSEKISSICKCWTELEGLHTDQNLQRYVHALFCNTVRQTLSKEWTYVTSWDCENLRNALLRINSRACQALAALLPSPWGGEQVLKAIHGNFAPSALDTVYELSRVEHLNACVHTCTDACTGEPRNVPRTRVELLCYAGLKQEALRLCLYYHNCPVLSEESFYGLTAFHLLHVTGSIKHLIDEVDNLTCHDGFHLVQLILREHSSVHPLAECLIQILLVRDLVGPSPYCCTLALMEMWCSLHVKQGTSLEVMEQEVQKLGSLATKSAHLYLLVDVLCKQYGRHLLPLYLNLYVHALTIDFNNLEYSRQVDCRIAIAELETHMSAIYTKLASLLADEEDQGLARECELTAFSLEPTIERLTQLQKYAMSSSTKWGYHHVVRLVPCSGECHCSVKGLCRRDPVVPPWFMTHVPSGILDSNLKGVSKQLLQDLCILIEGPRCRWLSWNMPWRSLHDICLHYLTTAREFRASTDDRRVGIEARLKRLGPFDSSTFPVPKNGHAPFINMDLQECKLEQNDIKSATENANEIGTSTAHGEMQINVSATSEIKTESEITKNVLDKKKDVSESYEPPVPVTNDTACASDFVPKQNLAENLQVSESCTESIFTSLDCGHENRTTKVAKVELAVIPKDALHRPGLPDNDIRSDLGMVQKMHNMQSNNLPFVKKTIVQNQSYLNVVKDCSDLTAKPVTTSLKTQSDQQGFSMLQPLPPPRKCPPTVPLSPNSTVNALQVRLSTVEIPSDAMAGSVRRFSTSPSSKQVLCSETTGDNSSQRFLSDSRLVKAEIVHGPVHQPTNEALINKNIGEKSFQTVSNPDSVQSLRYTSTEMSVGQVPLSGRRTTRECSATVTLCERIQIPMKEAVPPSTGLESCIVESLHCSPKKLCEKVVVSEAPNFSTSPLQSLSTPCAVSSVTMAPSILSSKCVSPESTTYSASAMPVQHCSAPLMDHMYGKNMMQPFFAEYPPVSNSSVQVAAQVPVLLSSMPTKAIPATSGSSQKMSTTVGPAYSKPHVGAAIKVIPIEATPSALSIIQPPGNVTIGEHNVFHAEIGTNFPKIDDVSQFGFKSVFQPTTNIPPAVFTECATLHGSNSSATVLLTSGTQSIYSIDASAQHLNLVRIPALGDISSTLNPMQTFSKTDVIPTQQVLPHATPKKNLAQSERVAQPALQPSAKIATTLAQQPAQAFILQPKMVHVKKSLPSFTPEDLTQVQQVVKATVSSQPNVSNDTTSVVHPPKKLINCAPPAAFFSSPSSGQNPSTALPSPVGTNSSIVRPLEEQHTTVPQGVASAKQFSPSRQHFLSQSISPRLPGLCTFKRNLTPISTLQRPAPPFTSIRSMATHQGQALQNEMSKPSGPNLLQRTSQSQSQIPECTLPSSPIRAPYKPPLCSGAISSQQESNTAVRPPNEILPLKSRLQMYTTPSRPQTRKPFNKPKTDGKPRWATTHNRHGKLCHHKNGQEKEAPTPRGTTIAKASEPNSTVNAIIACSPLQIAPAGPRGSIFKSGNMVTLNCTNVTTPVTTSNSTNSFFLTTNSEAMPTTKTVSDINTAPVTMIVSSDSTNSLCVRKMSTATERPVIRPSGLANSSASSKVSVAMVVPPDLSNCFGVDRVAPAVNQVAILPSTNNYDFSAAPALSLAEVPVPRRSNASVVSTAMFASTNRTTPTIANLHPNKSFCISTGSIPTPTASFSKSSINGSAVAAAVKSRFCGAFAPVASPNLTFAESAAPSSRSMNDTRRESVSTVKIPAQNSTGSSREGIAPVGLSESPNAATCSSHPTVTFNKLNLPGINIPVVKKCFSPAILSRAVNRSLPVSMQMLSSMTMALKPSVLKQDLAGPSVPGTPTPDPPSLPQPRRCPMNQPAIKGASKRKDLSPIQPATNLKCEPCVNASESVTKTLSEMNMEKVLFKRNSPLPSKYVTDSSPSSSQSQDTANPRDQPQKCLRPICDKVIMQNNQGMHMTNNHKSLRVSESAENRMPGNQQNLVNNALTDAKENSSASQIQVPVQNSSTNLHAAIVKEMILPANVTRAAEEMTTSPNVTRADECASDSHATNMWLTFEQEMPSMDSKSIIDDKNTNSTAACDVQVSFMHDTLSSPTSQSVVGKDSKQESTQKVHLTTTSFEPGENSAMRGRVSSRNIKPAQKRSCPCCENISPNSDAKKCRDDKLMRKSTHPKIPRKTRGMRNE